MGLIWVAPLWKEHLVFKIAIDYYVQLRKKLVGKKEEGRRKGGREERNKEEETHAIIILPLLDLNSLCYSKEKNNIWI